MLARLTLIVVTLFWITMNVLLWRAEFGAGKYSGTPVPPELVWQKIITAPDTSSLNVMRHGAKIGYCRWSAAVGRNGAASKLLLSEAAPEGLMDRPSVYQINFEGQVTPVEPGSRGFGFNLDVEFGKDHSWREARLHLNARPAQVDFIARAADSSLRIQLDEAGERSERVIKFADLQNPDALARAFDLPAALPLGALSALGLSQAGAQPSQLSLGLHWEAFNDWITIEHTPVRAYRLQARILDRYSIVLIVNRVGEILRVELPDQLTLVNDLTNL